MRPPRRPRHQLQRPLRRKVIHPVEIQLAAVRLPPECRVREVHMVVPGNRDPVGRVEPLALPPLRQHFHGAALIGSRHAPRPRLARVQPPLRVEGIPARAVRALSQHFRRMPRNPFDQPVAGSVAEYQVPVLGPRRAFRERETLGDQVQLECGKFLRPAQQRKHRSGHA